MRDKKKETHGAESPKMNNQKTQSAKVAFSANASLRNGRKEMCRKGDARKRVTNCDSPVSLAGVFEYGGVNLEPDEFGDERVRVDGYAPAAS